MGSRAILIIRGQKVLLDAELARLYGVTTARLNQQVRRNRQRFPADFVFVLTTQENASLMLRFATSKSGHGGRRKPMLAFTEHGAIMAATVLNSTAAVEMSIYVVRAFLKSRELLASNVELAKRLDELEARIVKRLGAHDRTIAGILAAVRQLTSPPSSKRRTIGFTGNLEEEP
jgi:hypothetical protein